MSARETWVQFRDFVAHSPPLDDAGFRSVLARIEAEPDAWLRRALIVTLVRPEREVLSDAQLREVADRFGGKIAAFVETILERRGRAT